MLLRGAGGDLAERSGVGGGEGQRGVGGEGGKGRRAEVGHNF